MIAVITPYGKSFDAFFKRTRILHKSEYKQIRCLNDIRGRNFTGAVKLHDCCLIEDLNEILNELELRCGIQQK